MPELGSKIQIINHKSTLVYSRAAAAAKKIHASAALHFWVEYKIL